MMNFKKPTIVEALLSLLYPRICAACSHSLFSHEKVICMHCERHLPRTGYEDWSENPIEKIFWGRVYIAAASALFFFGKGEKVQHLMHGLKYKGRKDIGFWLGKQLGLSLLEGGRIGQIDYIVPIPLHPKKEYQRGFNQSAIIGKGIAETTGWVLSPLLERTKYTESQTRKTKYDRWKNVSGKFRVNSGSELKGLNVLLVDDIVTTGATLEASAQVLLDAGVRRVYIATIAAA